MSPYPLREAFYLYLIFLGLKKEVSIPYRATSKTFIISKYFNFQKKTSHIWYLFTQNNLYLPLYKSWLVDSFLKLTHHSLVMGIRIKQDIRCLSSVNNIEKVIRHSFLCFIHKSKTHQMFFSYKTNK